MRFTINGYTVDIKAKTCYEERMNRKALLSFCNMLAIICREASNSYKMRNVNAIADMTEKMANKFHEIVEQNGGYEH